MPVALYACRIEDLGPHDRVKVDCWACGKNVGLLTADFLLRQNLRPVDFVLSIERRVKCRSCGSKGKAHVTVKWTKQAA
jgi:DNA-directed RNA polymerase subunit RPC12/RpoP